MDLRQCINFKNLTMKNLLAVSMGMVQKYGHKSAFLYSVMDNLYCEKMKAGELDSSGWLCENTSNLVSLSNLNIKSLNNHLIPLIKDGFIARQVIVSKTFYKVNLDVMNRFLDEWESKRRINSIGWGTKTCIWKLNENI